MTPPSRRRAATAATTAVVIAALVPSVATAAPRIVTSAGLPADPAREAAWQGFFSGLPHGKELDALTVLLAAPGDIASRCGNDAAGCYSGLLHQMMIPGTSGPDDDLTADVARHEYGHHVAAMSDNAPFSAGLGTKRWFTEERICERLRTGELSDDEDARYETSVQEGFAEAYRLVAGGNAHLRTVDPGLFPRAGTRRAILRDIRRPWPGDRELRFTGRLGPRRRELAVRLRVPLDGTVRAVVEGSAGLRPAVTLSSGPRVLARGRGAGRRVTVRTVACGRRGVRVGVRVRSGRGRYTLSVKLP
jgi:hypothetical protein